MKISILKREFYKKSGTELAKDLLGKILVHKLDGKYMRGRIVETARVGIDYAEEHRETPWRFYIRGNKFISKK